MVVKAFPLKVSSDFAFTGGVSTSKPYHHVEVYDTMIPFHWERTGMFENKRIAVLGAGKLGEALITGMVDAGIASRKQFIATAAHQERLDIIKNKLGVETTLSNNEAVRKAHLVLLCVKPQTVETVLRQVSEDLTPSHVLISVAASVTTPFMENILTKPVPVLRTMPNTPCFIKKGMTAIASGKHATAEHVMQDQKIFDGIGRTLILDEKHMDTVTG